MTAKILLAAAALSTAAPSVLADITYVSQTRQVNSATSDGFGSILSAPPIAAAPIAAPDFASFNQRSETAGGDRTGWSEQASLLLNDRITFSGLTGGQIMTPTSNSGQAWGTSVLNVDFSVAARRRFLLHSQYRYRRCVAKHNDGQRRRGTCEAARLIE